MDQDRSGRLPCSRSAAVFSVAATTRARFTRHFETKAKHAILMDADADLVFFEKDADALFPRQA